jgi:hypothetical protein
MLREGPIPRIVHGVWEYAVGVFLVAAPFLLGYDDVNMPLGISIATGVIVLVLASITQGPTGLVQQLPVSAHVTFDLLLAIFLIAAPFILGFADESTPRNLYIALGVAHLLISIGTRYRDAGDVGKKSSRGSGAASTRPGQAADSPTSTAVRTPPKPPTATGSSAATSERPASSPRPPADPPAGPPA